MKEKDIIFKNEYKIDKLLLVYLKEFTNKIKLAKSEKNKIKENITKLNKEIGELNLEIKSKENEKALLIYKSNIEYEKINNKIKKLQKDNELKKIIKNNELELSIKKLENETKEIINNIDIDFYKEKNEIREKMKKQQYLNKYKKLEFESNKIQYNLKYIEKEKSLFTELNDLSLIEQKNKDEEIIMFNKLKAKKNLELKTLDNELYLSLRKIKSFHQYNHHLIINQI